ncbi:MAG TPA: RNA polymerase sigma factor [Candidatus Angelobacter sp.]|nr:RNA polymerase sigma factor [Candidatus Angelobacter sp.]
MQAMVDQADAGTLFKAHHDRIHRYVLHLVQNSAEAEDLTQETFLRAHRRRDSLRDPRAALSWLYRIATHVCLDRLRQRKPQVSLDGDEGARRVASIRAVTPSALQAAERKETSQCVQRCLQFLPDHYRAVLLMHEVYSLTAAEIASLLRENLTTIKMRLHRARRMLEMVMECGCAVSQDACGLPVCQPRSRVRTRPAKPARRKH